MSRSTSPPARLFYAANEDGIPVSNACLSARGADRHCQRLRKRVADVHVIGRAVKS